MITKPYLMKYSIQNQENYIVSIRLDIMITKDTLHKVFTRFDNCISNFLFVNVFLTRHVISMNSDMYFILSRQEKNNEISLINKLNFVKDRNQLLNALS